MAESSTTPLAQKLGIKEGSRVLFVNPPKKFNAVVGPLPEGAAFIRQTAGNLDVILLFAPNASELSRKFMPLSKALAPTGGIWAAWPKKNSEVPTDLSDSLVREIGLAKGLVDNKVCAIDETWSALRFVVRRENRPKGA